MTKKDAGIFPRGDRYFYRKAIPVDIRSLYDGKVEIWRTLGTSDLVQARINAIQVKAEIHGEFERKRLEAQGGLHVRRFSDASLEAIALQFHDYVIDEDDKLRRFNLENGHSDPTAFARPGYLAAMKRDLTDGNFHHVSWWADAVIQRDGLQIVPNSVDYKYLCYCCQRAIVDAVKILIAWDAGDFSQRPQDTIITAPKRVADPAHSFEALFNRYRKDSASSPYSLDQDEKVIATFSEFLGPDADPLEVRGKHIRDFREALRVYPTYASQAAGFKGLTFHDVIKANTKVGRDTLGDKTINRYLSGISSFYKWLRSNDYVQNNPVDGKLIDKRKLVVKKPRRAFTQEELQAVIDKGWFNRPRDAIWWVSLLNLYTGARRAEIAQLQTADVKTFENRLCLLITNESDDDDAEHEKHIKNTNSRRIVPVHPQLLDFGFAKFATRKTRNGQVFPELKPDSREAWGVEVSVPFNKFLKTSGLKEIATRKGTLTYHSFRHTFITEMRRMYRSEEVDLLTGHVKTMGDGYNHTDDLIMKRKIEMIDSLDYRIDLSRLS